MTEVALSRRDIELILHSGHFTVSTDLAFKNDLGQGYELVSISTNAGNINICGIMTERDGRDDIEILGVSASRASGEQLFYHLSSPRIRIGRPSEKYARGYVSGFVVYDGLQAVFGVVASDFSVYLDVLADMKSIDPALHRRDLLWEFGDNAA